MTAGPVTGALLLFAVPAVGPPTLTAPALTTSAFATSAVTTPAPAAPALANPALAALSEPAIRSQQVLTNCVELRNLDPTQYWFWDAYFGLTDVLDVGDQRVGRLAIDPRICFQASLRNLEDSAQRTRGYRQAVVELIKWVSDEHTLESQLGTSSMVARVQLQKVTGLSFDTYEEWAEWWRQNRDYLWWSEDKGVLAVDRDAREAGATLHEDALVLEAEEYWFYDGRGWISQPRERGDYVLGNVLIPPHGYTFRTLRSELDDRDAKERGYLRAVENLIYDGLMRPELQQSSLDAIIERLATITDQGFSDRDSWIEWWERHQGRLRLSSSGAELITPSR